MNNYLCDVSVIIVNYNTKYFLEACLDSIRERCHGVSYEVIVVDNASSDGSCSRVKAGYSWTRLLENEENLGFGAANNIGAREAAGKYLLFLNSDTLFLNDALKAFFDHAEAEGPKLGVLGCWLRGADRRPVNSYGIFPTYAGCAAARMAFILPSRGCTTSEEMTRMARRVDCVTGADMFMKRELFLGMGGFDERFFMYYEETELQLRMARAGYRHAIIPEPGILHLEGRSSRGRMRSRLMMETSMYLYFAKTRGPSLGLYAFAFLHTLLSAFAIPRYTLSDNAIFYRSLRQRLPAILAGETPCSR